MGSSSDNGDETGDQPASTKPYLIRAIHEWALDNGFTPQILVATELEQVVVPWDHVKDNRIVLNIHPQSVKFLEMGNDYLMCTARFSGKPFEITVPVYAVQAIYARENGQGIVFQEEEGSPPAEPSPEPTTSKNLNSRPGIKKSTSDAGVSHLKLVK
jgi:stringent starvation protein B